MEWSMKQTLAHEESYEKFRQAYVDGETKTTPIEEIVDNTNRCVALIRPFYQISSHHQELDQVLGEMSHLSGLYFQDIPHFTVDCHRYLKGDQLPGDFKKMNPAEQQNAVISPAELFDYFEILKQETGKEPDYDMEIRGISFGGDGLVGRVWYDETRFDDFVQRVGEKVRSKVPSMNFLWGMARGKVPFRVVNFARFTNLEDKQKKIYFVDQNRDTEMSRFNLGSIDLVLADHYIQGNNLKTLGRFSLCK